MGVFDAQNSFQNVSSLSEFSEPAFITSLLSSTFRDYMWLSWKREKQTVKTFLVESHLVLLGNE